MPGIKQLATTQSINCWVDSHLDSIWPRKDFHGEHNRIWMELDWARICASDGRRRVNIRRMILSKWPIWQSFTNWEATCIIWVWLISGNGKNTAANAPALYPRTEEGFCPPSPYIRSIPYPSPYQNAWNPPPRNKRGLFSIFKYIMVM